jgi:hypothetical protein
VVALAADRENIRLLLAKGADPNRRMNIVGIFPTCHLFVAVPLGDPDVVRTLMAGGADIHEKDPGSMTALHWAVVAHHPVWPRP